MSLLAQPKLQPPSTTAQALMSPIKRHLFFVACLATIATINVTLFNKGVPITDGWYESYSYLLSKDISFDCAYPRLFIYFTNILQSIFGHELYVTRFAGIILHTACFFAVCKCAQHLFPSKAAITGTLVATLLYMQSVFFLAKDYHAFVHLMTALTFLSAVNIHKSPNSASKMKEALKIFTVGALICGLTLVKQNVGVFTGGAMGAMILWRSPNYLRLRTAVLMGAGLLFTLCAYAGLSYYYEGSLNTAFQFASTSRDAKGSVADVLFRFIMDPNPRHYLTLGIPLALAYLLIRRVKCNPSIISIKSKRAINYIPVISSAIFLLLLVINNYSVEYLIIGNVVVITILISSAARSALRNSRPTKLAVSGAFLASLWYCNTHSSPWLEHTGQYIITSFSLSASLWASSRVYPKITLPPLAAIAIGVSLLGMQTKYQNLFHWWGSTAGNIKQQTETVDIAGLKDMYMAPDAAKMYKEILQAIRPDRDKTLLSFPSIPYFHRITDLRPATKSIVHWFDVTSSTQLNNDLETIRTTSPPDYIIALHMPPYSYLVHERMLNRKLPQRDFYNQFAKWILERKYQWIGTWVTTGPGPHDSALQALLSIPIVVANPQFDSMTLGEIRQTIEIKLGPPNDWRIGLPEKDTWQALVDKVGMNENSDTKIHIGDQILVVGLTPHVIKILSETGFPATGQDPYDPSGPSCSIVYLLKKNQADN